MRMHSYSGHFARRSRRCAAAVAAGAAALLALAACSSGGSSSPSSSSTSAGGSLSVWTYFNTPQLSAEINTYTSIFKKQHPGVSVSVLHIPYAQFDGKLIAAAAAGTGPDVIFYVDGDVAELANGGALANISSDWSAFPQASLFPSTSVLKVNGDVYGVQGGVDVLGLWYNKTLMAKLGIAGPPTTIAQLNADLAIAKAKGYEGITFSGTPDNTGEWQMYPWATSYGFSYADPQEKPLAEALALGQSWVDDGYVSRDVSTWEQDVPFQQWTAGNVLFAENGEWNTTTAEQDAKFSYGVAPLPIGPAGKVYLAGTGVDVGAFSKSSALAWDYVQDAALSQTGELAALSDTGLIPMRSDLATAPQVKSQPITSAFMSIVSTQGSPYPATAIPQKNVAAVEKLVGEAWSAVLDGQQTPQSAAQSVIQQLQPLLQG